MPNWDRPRGRRCARKWRRPSGRASSNKGPSPGYAVSERTLPGTTRKPATRPTNCRIARSSCERRVIVETELKLHISAEHLQQLKRHPFLRSLSSGRAKTQKLYSIYYDTADLELRRQAMALRLRRVGRQWIQTLKGGGQVSA